MPAANLVPVAALPVYENEQHQQQQQHVPHPHPSYVPSHGKSKGVSRINVPIIYMEKIQNPVVDDDAGRALICQSNTVSYREIITIWITYYSNSCIMYSYMHAGKF